jgi:hypothetical protein
VWFRSLAVAAAVLQLGTTDLISAQQVGASRTVLATVVDSRGRTVVDIEVDDFVVRETGQLRDVLSVRVADYPIVLVLDNGRGTSKDFDVIRQGALRFVARIGRRPVAVALAEPPRLIATLDDDRQVVLQRIERSGTSRATEGLFESILAAARAVQENGSLFSAIVVVTANPISTAPAQLMTPILASGAHIHAIIGREGSGSNAFSPSSESLRALVDQTHGSQTTIFASASYPIAFDRLADQLAPELMVEYEVPVGSTSKDDVQLGVRIPGGRVVGRGVR